MPVCTRCGSYNEETARFCGNCGAPASGVATPSTPVETGAPQPPRRRGRARKFALYFLLIIGVTAAIWAFISIAGTPASAPTAPAVQIPASEQSFISIVSAAQSQSRNVDNDMQRGGVKAARDHSLCTQMGSLESLQVTDWVGTVDTVDSNSDGKGVLAVRVAPDITVETWNNDLSDIGSDTLIEPGSSVFQAASAMKQGDLVRFSGSFLPGTMFFGGGGDCLKESSLTLKGKVESPNFIFRFSGISAYSAALTTTTAEPAQPDAWQQFTFAEGRFNVLFLGSPQQSSQMIHLDNGETTMEYRFASAGNGTSYFVTYADYPPDVVGPSPQVFLHGYENFAINGKRLLADAEINLDGVPGRAFTFTDSYADGSSRSSNVHEFLAGTRLYTLTVLSPPIPLKGETATHADQFMNSFRIWGNPPSATDNSTTSTETAKPAPALSFQRSPESTGVTAAPLASQEITPTAAQPQASDVTQGMTSDQVVTILGPPISITTGAKHVYTYPHVIIDFTDGKVSEIH